MKALRGRFNGDGQENSSNRCHRSLPKWKIQRRYLHVAIEGGNNKAKKGSVASKWICMTRNRLGENKMSALISSWKNLDCCIHKVIHAFIIIQRKHCILASTFMKCLLLERQKPQALLRKNLCRNSKQKSYEKQMKFFPRETRDKLMVQ